MEFHQPLINKRPRSCAEVDVPGQPLQSFIPLLNAGYDYTPLQLDIPTAPDQLPAAYGFTAGFSSGIEAYEDAHLVFSSPKRRRLGPYTLLPSPGAVASLPNAYEKTADLTTLEHVPGGQSQMPSRWSDAALPSSQSPLARQMNNLSFLLCPCPGLGWEQRDGYSSLGEASTSEYDPEQPYTAEKQPSVPLSSQIMELPFPALDIGSYGPIGAGEGPEPLQPPQSTGESLLSSGYLHNEYGSQEADVVSPVAFVPDYLSNMEQPPLISCTVDYIDPLTPSPMPFQPVVGCVDSSPCSMVPVRPSDSGSSGCWRETPMQPLHPSSFDILLPDQRGGGKRGPFKDAKLREQTAQTRRTGSCIRCRMQRIRCESDPKDPGGICLTCASVANTKAGRFPCLRYKITDIKLYKPGQVPGYEWTRRWTNSITDPIQKWASSDIKVIHVSAGYSRKVIELQVRRFIPQDGDKLARTWDHQGTRRSVSIPPFALIDLEATKSTYERHIQDIMSDTIRNVLDCPDGLLYKTYFRAVRLTQDPTMEEDALKLIKLTLTLWVSIRLSTTSGFIVGDETLGMPNSILDDTSPSAGKIPMPPVMGAQLDLVLIHHIQTKLRRDMLEILQKLVLKNKQKSWFVTYLVTFILLHNTALITAHDAGYARKHGIKRRFAREDKVREYHLGANILLAHFHYCNKGMYPFSDECKDKDLRALADLSDDEIQFVHTTKKYAKQHRQEWEQVKEKSEYEEDFFFVSQLFEENWKPRPTI
ncbi:pre-mRNA splicing factor clf1 [Purpureocillium lavendulum]|uniref:Pre-mRNA splicing factor clf1 n=1 Tax=Purpureocillium lavendulum TaxID=1247861 RepID=A0AB34G3J0_9HYPO|nr:pre-mRNA splicing factor clf1 [Purpureocillium lavendulum]